MYLPALVYQLAASIIPAVVILSFAFYLFRMEFDKYLDVKYGQTSTASLDSLLPVKLQAHERMIVFVERINPSNLLVRLHQQGISVADLQSLVISEINVEYQHNITQQLYIEDATWNVIRKLKDDTVAMIGQGASGLPPDATGVDLSKRVLQHLSAMQENPYDLTLILIKKDLHNKL